MKRYLEVYNNEKTYLFPTMQPATPEIVALQYAVVNMDMVCVIETDVSKIMFYSTPEPINLVAERHDINPSHYYDDETLLKAIENKMNEPQPEPEPSAEERIASAMEFQNLMSL